MATKAVLQNGETRWSQRVTINGHRKKVRGRTREELENNIIVLREQERRRKLGIAEPGQKQDITYAALSERLLDHYTKRASSKRYLTSNIGYSLPRFGVEYVRDITIEDVEDWLFTLTGTRKGELSGTTKRHALRAIRQVLAYGVARDYLTKNVASKVALPEAGKANTFPFDSWAEVEKVATALGGVYERGYELVMFVAATGLRTQEWQVLRWSDFDLSIPCVTISRTLQLEGELTLGKTSASLAAVSLQDRAIQMLRRLPRPVTGQELLFPDPNGNIWNLKKFRYGVWQDSLDHAGVEYRGPYQLRHTFATLALEAGVPMEWISKQLRHETTQETERTYAKWTNKANRRWLDVLNAQESDPNRLGVLLEQLG